MNDFSRLSHISPRLIAERMTALAARYRSVVSDGYLPWHDSWLAELAGDFLHVAALVRRDERDQHRRAILLSDLSWANTAHSAIGDTLGVVA